MFKKILVANRGEIACRIMRTAKRMGIATVAVHSEADRGAFHVELADEAVSIGPPPAAQSYLAIDRIVAAAHQTGAEAVHPGYGFLSENPAFARALEAAGIIFIGPPAAAIEAMGDKITSKKLAAKAGVAIVPGHLGAVADEGEAERIAASIGFPVMIKAAAGGGGKGMRVAHDAAELREGFRLAGSEARSSFGDGRLFVEKFIEQPRHIEIQVLGDLHGNIIHLGERECSIQRRHQKIVEEAPSPFVDKQARAAMGDSAIALANAVSYASAGTVEFIVDRERNFYFLEMNTRLQVEHPVTELVTGLDLVEEMIRVAAGERLRVTQKDLWFSGWAIEARIYAEDPFRDFLPSAGRLTRFRPPGTPRADATIRLDTGVVEGSEISLFYDPMIAKLSIHAPDRGSAVDAMGKSLTQFVVDGVRHNIPFLAALMAHPRWQEGRLSTVFIEEEFPQGFTGKSLNTFERHILAAVAIAVEIAEMRRQLGRRGDLKLFTSKDWVIALEGEQIPFRVTRIENGKRLVLDVSFVNGSAMLVESEWRPGERVWQGEVAGERVIAQVQRLGATLTVLCRGGFSRARLTTARAAELEALMPHGTLADASKALRCPMPGLVVSIAVSEGQKITAGEALVVVEAMKMENVLRAERSATVGRILAKPGDSLAVDAVIMEFA